MKFTPPDRRKPARSMGLKSTQSCPSSAAAHRYLPSTVTADMFEHANVNAAEHLRARGPALRREQAAEHPQVLEVDEVADLLRACSEMHRPRRRQTARSYGAPIRSWLTWRPRSTSAYRHVAAEIHLLQGRPLLNRQAVVVEPVAIFRQSIGPVEIEGEAEPRAAR